MTNPIAAVVPRRGDSNLYTGTLETMGLVTLTVVPNAAEAQIICGLLRKHGIKAFPQNTVMTSSVWPVDSSGTEVIVDESDLAEARKVLEQQTR
jgi:Putative prokaryotic signal transducing protein